MKNLNLGQEIKELVSKDKIEEALNLIGNTIKDKNLEKISLMLLSRLNELNQNILLGIISREDRVLEKNIIRNSLLDIAFKMETQEFQTTTAIFNAEKRAEYISLTVKNLYNDGNVKIIRQQANLTSFSIPDAHFSQPIWDIYDGFTTRSDDYHKYIGAEKTWIGRHAREKGCILMVGLSVNDFLTRRGKDALCLRLKMLLDFVVQMNDKVDIVISKEAANTNILIIEDHFYAESFSKDESGYSDTFFSRDKIWLKHATRKFDKEFDKIMVGNNWSSTQEARAFAIDKIKEKLEEIGCRL